MKHLILMRHGKANKDAVSGEDFERDLAERGRLEAQAIAKALKMRGLMPDLALVSSSHRTVQTFEAMKPTLGQVRLEIIDDLYNADSFLLREHIEAHETAAETILVIAHNPGIQYLAVDYMTLGSISITEIDAVRSHYPTAMTTCFQVDPAGRPIYMDTLRPKDFLGVERE
jgi:phosphohistidine phosphatase